MDLSPLKIDRGASRAKRRRGGFPWMFVILLAGLAGLGFLFQKPLLREIDRLRLPKVQTSEVYRPDARAASASGGTAANGYIIAKTRAALSADTPGRIVELNVEEGSVVKAGDVVARLYSEELEAALMAAEALIAATEAAVVSAEAQVNSAEAALPDLEAQVTVAETRVISAQSAIESSAAVASLADINLKRALELLENDVGTQERLDSAQSEQARSTAELARARAELTTQQANVAAARASLERARADVASSEAAVAQAKTQVPVQRALYDQAAATLDKTVVRAPFDGIVVLKDAEIGEVVSPNSQGASSRGSVATMVDFQSLEVQIELPETSIAAARPGGPAQVFLDAYPNRAYSGRVDRVWPTANRQKGTIEVRVAIDHPDEDLRPEMGVRVTFQAEAAEPRPEKAGPAALRVTSSAVLPMDGQPSVFLVERDRVRVVPVQLGATHGAEVEVLEGLREGDRVVNSPASDLADGDRVQQPTN